MAENTKSQQPTWEGIKDEFNAIAQSLTQYFENFKGESWKTFEPLNYLKSYDIYDKMTKNYSV